MAIDSADDEPGRICFPRDESDIRNGTVNTQAVEAD
jgi:hypothetical protein